MKYNDIFKKYNITLSDLKKIINKYKLTRKKSELYKGNQNAKNNRGGNAKKNNKNAVATGEYEKIYGNVLTKEELNLYNNYKIDSIDNLLIEEYKAEYKLLIIRERRMLERIKKLEEKNQEMTIGFIRQKKTSNTTETTTQTEQILKMIQRIEDGLTRVEESKRKIRENIIKLGFSKKTLELKEKQAENELW